jgi:hypothetical protein
VGTLEPSVRNRIFVLVGFAAGLSLAASIGLCIVSMVPFEAMRPGVVDAVGVDYANRFTPALHAHFVTSVRLLSGLLLVAGALVVFAANPVAIRIEYAIPGGRQLTSEIAAGIRRLCTEDRPHLLALCSILAWAILIRCRYLFEPMRSDEGYSFLSYGSRPLFVGLSYFSANNHVLNTVLTHFSYVVFGDAPWALRLPVLLAGIAIVPLTYAAMRLSSNKLVALLSAALVSSSFPLIEYSTNSRGYGLGTAFLLGMFVCVALARRVPAAWVPASICAGLSVCSVVTMSFGVAGVLLWAAWTTQSVRFAARLAAGTTVMGALLYTPVLVVGGLSAFTSSPWATHYPIRELIPALPQSAADVWSYWNLRLPFALTVLIAAGVAAGIVQWIATRASRPPVFLLLTMSSIALLLAAGINPPRRVYLFLLPLFFGTAAQGWVFLSHRSRKATAALPAIAVLVCAWMGIAVLRGGEMYRSRNPEEYGFPNAERLVLDHKQYLERGSAVVYSANPASQDVPIQFEMFRRGIRGAPSPSAELLIVATPGQLPLSIHGYRSDTPLMGIRVIRKIASYEDADVYLGKRDAVSAPPTSAGE